MKITKKHLMSLPRLTKEEANEMYKEWQVNGLTYYGKPAVDEESILKALNKRYTILYYNYTYENYSGDAYVLGLDKQDSTFFEVIGSHCSCYGLEGQWSPEPCTVAELTELFKRRKEAYLDDENGGYSGVNRDAQFWKWLEG